MNGIKYEFWKYRNIARGTGNNRKGGIFCEEFFSGSRICRDPLGNFVTSTSSDCVKSFFCFKNYCVLFALYAYEQNSPTYSTTIF